MVHSAADMFQLKPLPRTLAAALRDLESTKTNVRRSALTDLVRLAEGDDRSRVVSALENALIHDAEVQIRGAAAVALADADARHAIDTLVRAYDDAHEHVKQMVLLALGELSPVGHRGTINVVAQALDSDSSALRFQALIAGQRLRLDGWSKRLRVAIGDDDPKIRYLALRLVDEYDASREGEGLPTDLLNRVERALSDESPEVRVAAALVAGPKGSSQARQVIADALNRRLTLSEPSDEQSVIELAGELGIREAAPGLWRIVRGAFGLVPGRFAWHARVALAQLGDETARAQIYKGLRSRQRDVRSLSVAAVGRSRWVELLPELEAMERKGSADPDALAEALSLLRDGR